MIEVDGGQHLDSHDDLQRDRFMQAKGFKVLRFWNNDVLANLEGVCGVIAHGLFERCPHHRLPACAEEADKGA